MSKPYLIASAKKPEELDAAYKKAKDSAAAYGFSSVAALKDDVVMKAMKDGKKGADFLVEVEVKNNALIAQMVCDVKGKMRSVIGRKQFKDANDFLGAKALAADQALKHSVQEMYGKK